MKYRILDIILPIIVIIAGSVIVQADIKDISTKNYISNLCTTEILLIEEHGYLEPEEKSYIEARLANYPDAKVNGTTEKVQQGESVFIQIEADGQKAIATGTAK